MQHRPEPTEYEPYYGLYIDQVPEGNVVELLESELEAMLGLLRAIPADREPFRYAEGKWSIREVVGHLIDTERTFGHRALVFARRDPARLPGIDQDEWANASNAYGRPLGELLDEFEHVRRGHVAMFGGFDESAGSRSGIASGCSFTVRSLAYILVGHEIHHRKVLRERYLAAAT